MIVAILLPVILPILGDFISPFLFLAGILAILISKVSWPVKIISIVIPIVIIVIFWNEYLSWILKFS